MLMPVLENTAVHFAVEYSSAKKQVIMTAAYGGGRFDPLAAGNELSYKVLNSSVDELKYEYDPNDEYAKNVRVCFTEHQEG